MQINLGENNSTAKLIKHIIKARYRIAIMNCDIVNRMTINAHAPGTILLWNKLNRNRARAERLTNVALIK
jgi:hypothetical protein